MYHSKATRLGNQKRMVMLYSLKQSQGHILYSCCNSKTATIKNLKRWKLCVWDIVCLYRERLLDLCLHICHDEETSALFSLECEECNTKEEEQCLWTERFAWLDSRNCFLWRKTGLELSYLQPFVNPSTRQLSVLFPTECLLRCLSCLLP